MPTAVRLRFRGQSFPSANSLSMSMSNAWFATSFFNRAFSASSSFNRFASDDFMPPYWASHRCHVDSATSKWRHTSSSSLPAGQLLVALSELADDLIRRMPPTLLGCHGAVIPPALTGIRVAQHLDHYEGLSSTRRSPKPALAPAWACGLIDLGAHHHTIHLPGDALIALDVPTAGRQGRTEATPAAGDVPGARSELTATT